MSMNLFKIKISFLTFISNSPLKGSTVLYHLLSYCFLFPPSVFFQRRVSFLVFFSANFSFPPFSFLVFPRLSFPPFLLRIPPSSDLIFTLFEVSLINQRQPRRRQWQWRRRRRWSIFSFLFHAKIIFHSLPAISPLLYSFLSPRVHFVSLLSLLIRDSDSYLSCYRVFDLITPRFYEWPRSKKSYLAWLNRYW